MMHGLGMRSHAVQVFKPDLVQQQVTTGNSWAKQCEDHAEVMIQPLRSMSPKDFSEG